MCSWDPLSSSNNFTNYLSPYSVFMSSIAGVKPSDYYSVPKGYLQIKDLYSARKSGPYFFRFGINWRGYAACVSGTLINIVGLVVPSAARFLLEPNTSTSQLPDFLGSSLTGSGSNRECFSSLNFFCRFIVTSGTYYLLSRFFPVPVISAHWLEVGKDIIDVSLAYRDSNSYDEEPTKPEGVGDADLANHKIHEA